MKKSTLILLISTAIFFTSTLVLLYSNYLKPTQTFTPTTGIIPTDTPIPTVDPTADWKIHENKELGISYKYPSTWYLDGELLMDEACKKYSECLALSFKSTTKSLQQLTSEIATSDIAIDNSDVKPVLITLGDNQVYEFRYGTAIGLGLRTLYFSHGNRHLLIEHFIPEDGSEKEINQILSTLKFASSDYLLEDGSTYGVINNPLSWDSCGTEDNEISRNIKQKISALAQVSQKEINGLKIIKTPTLGLTQTDINRFYICQAGAFSPLKVFTDKILWISSCGTGAAWDGAEKCEETRSSIEKLYQ